MACEGDYYPFEPHRINFPLFWRCLGSKNAPTEAPRAPQRRPKLSKVMPRGTQNGTKSHLGAMQGANVLPEVLGVPPLRKKTSKRHNSLG